MTNPKRCSVKGCLVESGRDISFNGDFCFPCYEFITQGKANYSTAYRNSAIPALRSLVAGMDQLVFHIQQSPWFAGPDETPTQVYLRLREEAEARAGLVLEHCGG